MLCYVHLENNTAQREGVGENRRGHKKQHFVQIIMVIYVFVCFYMCMNVCIHAMSPRGQKKVRDTWGQEGQRVMRQLGIKPRAFGRVAGALYY